MTWVADPLPGFVPVEHVPQQSIDDRCDAWLAANPWVLPALEVLADQRLAAGVTRFGVKALVERLRWDWEADHVSGRWRINNSYTSRLARRLVERRPEFGACIELRELRSL